MYFSEQFKIIRKPTDDWFDPILESDTKLFVDPFLVFDEAKGRWKESHKHLMDHFDRCFQLVAQSGGNDNAVAYKKALALLRFPEPREFCLGYTARGTGGAGGGDGYAKLIAESMQAAITRGISSLGHFEELGVISEGIGPDRISDLTCSVLRSEFIAYTSVVAARHKLPMTTTRMGGVTFDPARQAWRSADVDLPINPENGLPILLVPRRFLRDLPTLDPHDWWDNYEAQQLRNDLNYEVMGRVTKKTIVKVAKQRLEEVQEWAKQKEGEDVTPYDFKRDPLGVWNWLSETRKFAEAQPVTLSPPSTNDEFDDVIELVLEKFKHFVEQERGWSLLWNDGNTKEKPEEAAQLLFRGIAKHYCEANNIVLDREVELGRGPVDFKFSNGYSNRALLEVKKLHSGKFWTGLERQLPSYLNSGECTKGWYLAIQYRPKGASEDWARTLPGKLKAISDSNGISVKFEKVDAMPKKSASKL